VNRPRPSGARARLLLLRADASPELGGGHVMRLLALADSHQRRGGRALFALNRAAEPLHGALRRRGHDIALIAAASGSAGDVDESEALLRQHEAGAIIVDGPFAVDLERQLAARGAGPVVVIDDSAGRATAAQVLVNPNAGAELATYTSDGSTALLLGPRYALIRPEFGGRARRTRRINLGPIGCLLISFGASDPVGGTTRVLRALPAVLAMRVLVVLGAHHARPDRVLEAAQLAGRLGHSVEVLSAPPDMAQIMTEADAAISAAGGTLLELACVGCPTLAFVVADNQLPGSRAMTAAGCVAGGDDLRSLDDADLARRVADFLGDADRRRQIAGRARRMVDGLGAGRILTAVERLISGPGARLEAIA